MNRLTYMILALLSACAMNAHAQDGEINPDMFINHWRDAEPRIVHGAMHIRDILTPALGDPLAPVKRGAVLTDLARVSHALIMADSETDESALSGEQYVLYVTGGTGEVRTAVTSEPLHEGIGAIIPPGITFSIANTGRLPLSLYLIVEPIPRGFVPNGGVVVRSEEDNMIATNVQRADLPNLLLSYRDGLAVLTALNPVTFVPGTFYPPHVHPEGTEEVWLALLGDMEIMIGEHHRDLPAGAAYKVPADARTPHVNINPDEVSRKLLWMMKQVP